MQTYQMPLGLRLTGCWLLWSAWCSLSGWGLSSLSELSGWGHLALLPVLLAAGWCWLKGTAGPANHFLHATPWRRRWLRPLPLIYLVIVGLSFLGAVINSNPWSIDAVSYRLPRVLYWWGAHHWYWIGTLDHRLDFSSCGYEWQALPIIELTQSDRFLFLINFVPYLLMPGLVFQALRILGVSGRSSVRWMWLLPSGYCYALQCGGLQNDGYAVDYTLAALVLADAGARQKNSGFVWLAAAAAALLTGTKVSNLPLLLPLGLVLWPALRRISLFSWKTPVAVTAVVFCSFVPLALLALKHTGDWTGDPTDQWNVKIHNPVGGVVANLILLANDALQLPVMPGAEHITTIMAGWEQRAGPVFTWLKHAHGEFNGVHFGEMPYEASAALGFGLCFYLGFLILGCFWVRFPSTPAGRRTARPWPTRLVWGAAWLAFGVYLAKLGSYESARIAAPYYPLLLAPILAWPRLAWLERKKFFHMLACIAALTGMPIIFLTPARPLIPIQTLAQISHQRALIKVADQYRLWKGLHDDLAPLRAALPPDATLLGYAGGFGDTSYGLWKPFGRRTVSELGLPAGSPSKPSPDMNYAVVTVRGLQERYAMDLKSWLSDTDGRVIFEFQRNRNLESHSAPDYESWYLVKFGAK